MKEQKRSAARTKSQSAANRRDNSEVIVDVAREHNPARLTQEARKQWEDSLASQSPARLDRIYADLVKLLNSPALHDEAHWKEVKAYVDFIRWKFRLPRMYTFHPRGSVPSGMGHKGYNEDYYSAKYYTPKEGQSVAPARSRCVIAGSNARTSQDCSINRRQSSTELLRRSVSVNGL